MTLFKKIKFDKLIRDKIYYVMLERGIDITTRKLDADAYTQALSKKLYEEVDELMSSQTHADKVEEMADVMEVVHAFMQAFDITAEAVEQARLKKWQDRGGFIDQRYVDYITLAEDHPLMQYYREQPHRYPELD